MKLTSEKIFKYPPTGMEAFLTILFIVTLGWLYSLLQLLNLKDGGGFGPVSYTHLTLPTICSV